VTLPAHQDIGLKQISTKTAAEAVLRELPSVLGAYVSEDMEGHPREIHLLVRHGPDAATLARDVRGLLQERLGIPIDQRVISIAQLAPERTVETGPDLAPDALEPEEAMASTRRASERSTDAAIHSRPLFAGLESTVASGRVQVGVRLSWEGEESEGISEAVDTHAGRARAAATATLRSAIDAPWSVNLNLELDFASIVQALDGEYVLVSVLGMANRLGRRPLPLVGAQPIESDIESAAALATLKAINRILGLSLRPPGGA
jgi:hypothetical protein